MIKYNQLFLNSKIDKKYKNKFKICHFFYLINSLFEIVGISIIIPIISFVLNIDTKFFSINNMKFFSNYSETTKVIFLFSFIIIFFFLRSTLQLFILTYQRKFIAKFQRNLAEKVFKRSIFVDLKDLEKKPLNEQVRNLNDTGYLTSFTENLISLNANLILSGFIITFLFIYDFKITLFFIIISNSGICFKITNSFFILQKRLEKEQGKF